MATGHIGGGVWQHCQPSKHLEWRISREILVTGVQSLGNFSLQYWGISVVLYLQGRIIISILKWKLHVQIIYLLHEMISSFRRTFLSFKS